MRSGGQDFSRHPDVLEVTDEAARRPESNPLSVSPCAPRARPVPRSAVGHPAHGAGRRGRRPLPPILPRRGPAREGLAPPSAPGCQEVEGAPRAGTVSWWTKKPLSPDAEEMEQGVTRRVEEFYDGIEKRRRNEGQ